MNIWLLQRSEPTPHDNRGGQRQLRTGIIAKIFSELGHNVIWWTSCYDHYNKIMRYTHNTRVNVSDNYQIIYLKTTAYTKNVSLKRVISNICAAKNFTKVASSIKSVPDIIIASIPTVELAWRAIKFGKTHKIPVILDVRDLWPDHIYEYFPKYYRWLVKIILIPNHKLTTKVFQEATGITGISRPIIEWGLRYAGRPWNQNDHVFPLGYIKNTVGLNEAQKAERFWDSLGIYKNNNSLIVILIGTLSKKFDLDIVFHTAIQLNNNGIPVKFVICGNGEKFILYKDSIANIRNIIMPGWIDDAKIKVLLQRSDIGLLPYTDYNSFIMSIPNKVAEYLSGGLMLALSFKKGAMFELINEYGCGFSYHMNSKILYDKLIYFTNNKNVLENKKKKSVTTFNERFDGLQVYSQMLDYLQHISNSPK